MPGSIINIAKPVIALVGQFWMILMQREWSIASRSGKEFIKSHLNTSVEVRGHTTLVCVRVVKLVIALIVELKTWGLANLNARY